MFKPFTVRECSGWCVEVTFPSSPAGSSATHLVANCGENERQARQIAEDCNHAVNVGRVNAVLPYLAEREREVLFEVMRRQEISGEAVMRKALRMLQFLDSYWLQNMELCFRTKDGEIIRPFHHEKMAPYVEDDKS